MNQGDTMRRYVLMADLLFVDDKNRSRRESSQGRIDDEDVSRPEFPDKTGRTLGRFSGIEDLKLNRGFPWASAGTAGPCGHGPSTAFSPGHFPRQQANADASGGVISFPPVPDPEHKQALRPLELPGNCLAPTGF